MREKRKRRSAKKLDSVIGWIDRYCLPTMDWQHKYNFITYLYIDVGSTRISQYNLTYKELTGRITLIFFSAGAFGTGLGQFIAKLVER